MRAVLFYVIKLNNPGRYSDSLLKANQHCLYPILVEYRMLLHG